MIHRENNFSNYEKLLFSTLWDNLSWRKIFHQSCELKMEQKEEKKTFFFSPPSLTKCWKPETKNPGHKLFEVPFGVNRSDISGMVYKILYWRWYIRFFHPLSFIHSLEIHYKSVTHPDYSLNSQSNFTCCK